MEKDLIIKALECCTNCICNHAKTDTECPLVKMNFCKNYLMKQSLALINELTAKTEAQDIVIAELRKLLEKANHDANRYARKIEELTEENEWLGGEKEHLELVVEGKLKRTSALERQVLSLTEENERLTSLCVSKDVIIDDMNAENERLRAENKIEYETPLGKQTMPNLLHLEGDVARLYTQIKNEIKANTVRKMQERLKTCFEDNTKYDGWRVSVWIDQIAKEILEGE